MLALIGAFIFALDFLGAVESTETIRSWQSLGLFVFALHFVFPVPMPVAWPWQRRGLG